MGNDSQHLVAGAMTIDIVEFLEMIHIQQCQGASLSWFERDPRFHVLIKCPAIRNTRQCIGLGTKLRRLDLHRLLMNPFLSLLELHLHLFIGRDQIADGPNHRIVRSFLSLGMFLKKRVIDRLHLGLMRVDVSRHGKGIGLQSLAHFRNLMPNSLDFIRLPPSRRALLPPTLLNPQHTNGMHDPAADKSGTGTTHRDRQIKPHRSSVPTLHSPQSPICSLKRPSCVVQLRFWVW